MKNYGHSYKIRSFLFISKIISKNYLQLEYFLEKVQGISI